MEELSRLAKIEMDILRVPSDNLANDNVAKGRLSILEQLMGEDWGKALNKKYEKAIAEQGESSGI